MTRAAINRLLRRLALSAGSVLLVACAARSVVDAPGSAAVIPAAGPVAASTSSNAGRTGAIRGYRDYLARYPESPERDTISRRLADLLVEEGEDQQSYAEAIGLYEYLLGKAPQSTELLYQLSRAYEESGRSQQALMAIDRLLASQPADNRLYSDTRFRRGELLFSEGDYVEAGLAYQAVVDLGASAPAYEQSLYKFGWSLFKQERYREALPPLLTLLDLKLAPARADAPLSGLSAADREQLVDLLRVISGSFAQLDGVNSVERYFSRVGWRAYERGVYLQLAQWYVGHDQVSEAAGTWLFLAHRDPLAPEAPGLVARAIDSYRQAGFQQRVVATQMQFLQAYGMDSEFWTLHSPEDFPAVVELLQSSARNLSRLAREQAHRTADPADVRVAEQRYREYLAHFGDTAHAPEMNYQLAELLYENGGYRRALAEYRRTAWSRGPHPRAAEAALGALRASDKLLPDASTGERATLVAGATADAQRFVENHPDHPAAPALLARAGTGLLEQQEYEQALELGRQAVSIATPESPALRQLGWSLQAQALFALEDYPGAAAAYGEALQLAGGEDGRRTALRRGLAMSIYRQAGRLGDRDAAVALYQQAAALAPDATVRSRAEYDAATVLLAQESWAAAIVLLERFRNEYPDDALQQEVTLRLAHAHERNADPLQAAREYQRVARDRLQAEPLQREALLRAADLYRQAGEVREAIAARERYLQRFPQPAGVAVEVMLQLADLAAQREDIRRRHYWLEAIIELDLDSASARTREIAARAALELAEHQLAAFRRVQLVNPVQENLTRKIEAMKRALEAFDVAIDYGISPVTTAATYHVASMYDELGSALLTSERPLDLTAEERAEYDLLLAKQAAPFEQQAIDLYTSNARRTDVDQRDPWIEKSAQQLDELRRTR